MNHSLGCILIVIQAGSLCKWTNDSQQFLLEHLDTIHESPSQIYHSALPISPPSTWLQDCYGSELSQEVKIVNRLPVRWGICSRTVSLGTRVFELSYSNNMLAVGSGGRDIIILDAITGSQTAILSGHTDEVLSVVFSSDRRSLASGSVIWLSSSGICRQVGLLKPSLAILGQFALFPFQWTASQLLQAHMIKQSDYGILRQGSVTTS
jgi:WD40 repeat protein